jgi:hypothetical protein
MKRGYIRAAATAGCCALWLGPNVQASPLADIRHKPPLLDRSADYSEFSESSLLTTPCSPEEDGFFGGTFGQPVEFQYVFEMEISSDGETSKALDAIRNHVVDAVVIDTFPQLCGATRRRLGEIELTQRSKITGFRFDKMPILDLDRKSFTRRIRPL